MVPRDESVKGFEFAKGRYVTFTNDESAQDIRNSPADAHANEFGNRLLADKALAALYDAGLLVPMKTTPSTDTEKR